MSDVNPATARYLSRLADELSRLPPQDRADIVREISDHITDALAAGRTPDEVLSGLGPATALARAYAVELAMNPPDRRPSRIDRALTIIGWLAVASLPSFVIIVVLGAVGVALTAAGVAVLIAGVAAMFNPALVPNLTVQPWVCAIAGVALILVGGGALDALYLYLRFLINVTKQTLARVRS